MATVRAIIWSFEGALVHAGPGPVLPIRGADHPLNDIPARLVAFGLVSERPREVLVEALEKLGWTPRFGAIVAGDDDPSTSVMSPSEALRRALEALAVTPSETLIVTSSPATVVAGKALGSRVAALAGPGDLAELKQASFVVSHPGAITDLLRLLR